MRNEGLRRFATAGLWVLAVAIAYYASAKVGLLQQLVRGQVTPLWPPTGIALAALLLLGLRAWPGIALGAFLVNVTLGPSPLAVLGIVAGNTLALVGAYLLLRRVGFRIELDRLRDATALVFLGALVGMMISATVGSGVLVLSGALPASRFWPTWSVWWTGDAMGVLVFTPLLLLVRTARPPRGVRPYRWAEAALLLAGTFLVALLVTRGNFTLLFLVFPFLIWAAMRFQLTGAAPCVLVVSVVAVTAAAQGTGPFAERDLFANMVTLQALNGTVALTALLLSAIISERNRTHAEIERICVQLTEVVAQLEAGETSPWPRPTRRERRDGRLPP